MSNAWKRKSRHEAAHSFIVWHGGGLISKVTIMPQPGEISGARGICYCASAEGQTITARPSKILTANRVHILIAGRCADELFFPDKPAGHVQDFEELIALMPDSRETLEMHSFDRSKKSIEDFYEQFKGPVLKLFRSRRGKRALFALTDALGEAGTLSGAAAVSVLEKAWGKPLPPKAIPASEHIALIDEGPNSYEDVLFHLGAYLRVMEADVNRLRGDLPEEEEDHLGRIHFYLKMLELEINQKIKIRQRSKNL
jgi:hypothetical protein